VVKDAVAKQSAGVEKPIREDCTGVLQYPHDAWNSRGSASMRVHGHVQITGGGLQARSSGSLQVSTWAGLTCPAGVPARRIKVR